MHTRRAHLPRLVGRLPHSLSLSPTAVFLPLPAGAGDGTVHWFVQQPNLLMTLAVNGNGSAVGDPQRWDTWFTGVESDPIRQPCALFWGLASSEGDAH